MDEAEVNYENVRNIPIHLFDGSVVEKKKVETKHVYKQVINKERKELIEENDTKQSHISTLEKKRIPIKINLIDGQNDGSDKKYEFLSSSIPSISEASSRRFYTTSLGRQRRLNTIKHDLEESQKKLASHLQEIDSKSTTGLEAMERNINTRSRSLEPVASKSNQERHTTNTLKREESTVDLEKYMEVWKNISDDLDEIIRKANIERDSQQHRSQKETTVTRKTTKEKKEGEVTEKDDTPLKLKNVLPTDGIGDPNNNMTEDLKKGHEDLKSEKIRGAKGLRDMLRENSRERNKVNVETKENERKKNEEPPKPPKRDARSNFYPSPELSNDQEIFQNSSGNKKLMEVGVATDDACYACDACTQTGSEKERGNGCLVM